MNPTIDVFLLFPDSDDDILYIVDNPKLYEDIVQTIHKIKKITNNNNLKMYYDSENVKTFKEKSELIDFQKDANKTFNSLTYIFANTKNIININKDHLCDKECYYTCWDSDNFSLVFDVEEIVKSTFERDPDNCCLFSFVCNIPTKYDFISIIKDARHLEKFPQIHTIPIFHAIGDFREWLNIFNNEPFSLRDRNIFIPTHKTWNMARIYEKKEDKSFWYFDFFHKDEGRPHYEVFNNQGLHLYEADANSGEEIPDSQDNNKRISHIL